MRAQKLPYKIVDLNRSHRQVEMRFPDEGPTHRQVEMRFPKWSSQNFPTNSLQRTNPVDRSKWGTQVWGPKTYEIAEVPHRQVEMRFPKTTAQKLSYKIAPLNKSLEMRFPKWGPQKYATKLAHKSHPQVETRFQKTMTQNRSPEEVPSIDRSKWGSQKEGSKNYPTKSLSPFWANREGEFFDVPRTRSVATYAADSALVLMHDGEE